MTAGGTTRNNDCAGTDLHNIRAPHCNVNTVIAGCRDLLVAHLMNGYRPSSWCVVMTIGDHPHDPVGKATREQQCVVKDRLLSHPASVQFHR